MAHPGGSAGGARHMTEITSTVQIVLQEAGYATWLVPTEQHTAVCFEDDALMGFACIFDEPSRLLQDGKKCYFRADKLLPREDLVWSYDAKKLDLDEGTTVRGQRHYAPQELKAIAIERPMREDDQAPPKRKKIRGRPSRDNDDDD